MALSFEQILIEVWRQTLVEDAKVVELDTARYRVWRTPKRGLRQVDVVFDGNEIGGWRTNASRHRFIGPLRRIVTKLARCCWARAEKLDKYEPVLTSDSPLLQTA